MDLAKAVELMQEHSEHCTVAHGSTNAMAASCEECKRYIAEFMAALDLTVEDVYQDNTHVRSPMFQEARRFFERMFPRESVEQQASKWD